MALSQADRIQISGEMIDLPLKIDAANQTQVQLAGVKTDLQNQDNSLKIFFDKYNDIANAYQTERRWVDGTTYSTVVNQDLIDGAKRVSGNKFYPGASWTNFQPQKHASTEGNPTTTSLDSELAIFTNSITNGGLTILLNFLLNGQTSAVLDDTLASTYTPSSGTMSVTTGGQTVNNLIIVKDGMISALFLVTASAGTTLTVTEIIPPSAPLTSGAAVVENIIAFTNSERNTLTSTNYQDVLTGLAQKIKDAVDLWETALNNQLAQLNLNTDSRSPQGSEITAAKADVNSAKTVITTWKALPDTGTTLIDSKFVNVNITPLQTKVTSRTSFSTTRNTQITTALGSITQNPDGTFTGVGIYYLRFVQIDSRINLAGGPLTEFYEKDVATAGLAQIVTNANQRSATFSAELKVEGLAVNAPGNNTVTLNSSSGFSVSDSIFVMADTLTELSGTITAINGNALILSITVPNTYTKDKKARLYKQL